MVNHIEDYLNLFIAAKMAKHKADKEKNKKWWDEFVDLNQK